MSPARIPWAKPYIGEEEIEAVTAALRERRLTMGVDVRGLEAQAAELAGRSHAVAVSNGTVALDLALDLAGVEPGDEVLVSALAYIATTNAIVRRGAVPVFCDVDPVTLNIRPGEVAARMSARTRALLVADYCGSPVDHRRLVPLCEEHRVALVVDGAQSLGASLDGRPACAYGTVATTSFHTAKALLCGEGGMVFTDRPELAERAARLRGQGEVPGRKYVHDVLASNHRLPEVSAAIGRAQLRRAPAVFARRREIAMRYTEAMSVMEDVTLVPPLPGARHAWFSFPIRIPRRDAVAAALAERGVETRSLYPVPAYRQPIPEYAPYAAERRPAAEAASAEVLNLPMFFEMTDAEVDTVVGALGRALDVSAVELRAAA